MLETAVKQPSVKATVKGVDVPLANVLHLNSTRLVKLHAVPGTSQKMVDLTHQRLKVDAVQSSPVYVSPDTEEVGDMRPVTMLRTRCRISRQSSWLALGAIKIVTFAHQTKSKSDPHVG